MKNPSFHDRNEASVLILTLWVIFFLSALAVAVGAYVESGIRSARSARGRTMGLYLARVGAEQAIQAVAEDTNAWDGLTEVWAGAGDEFKAVPCTVGLYDIVLPGTTGAVTQVGMRDEERLISINKADQSVLKALFAGVGQLSADAAADLAASIVDWRDENDDVLTGGAENAYYQTLSSPVECHNGEFQSLQELLWVKGMTDEIMARIEPYITIYGTGKVNLNTADPVVLQTLMLASGGNSGAASSLLQHIAAFRAAGREFTSADTATIFQELGGSASLTPEESSVFSSIMGWVTVRSSCFSGRVIAKPYPPAGASSTQTPDSIRQVEFTYDRLHARRCYWHEN